jgi:hypothetical protein
MFQDSAIAQADKVKTAMADLKARTEKLGAPKVEGNDLYRHNESGNSIEPLLPREVAGLPMAPKLAPNHK